MEVKQSFSTSEVARYCHVTADTIRKWAEAGRIKVFKTPGGHRRIRRDELLRFLQENGIPMHPELTAAGVKVLIVDNDPSVASSITRFLERIPGNFKIETAADGYDVGYQVATFRPDVLFFNVWLNGLDGIDVCRRIKADPGMTEARIVALVDGHDERVANDRMVSVTLRKPFTPDDLRRTFARVGVEIS